METPNGRGNDGGQPRRSRRQVLAAAGGLGASVVAGCLGSDDGPSAGGSDGMTDAPTAEESSGEQETSTAASGQGTSTAAMDTADGMATPTRTSEPAVAGEQPTAVDATAWRSVEFSPVRRDETVTVDAFDRPVVLEAFAVWCPKCTRQQNEMRGLDDSVVPISINVDPNEDPEKVRAHANDHGFDWRYVVAPPEMVQSLVGAFGSTVTNAPSTPVVVACQGGGSSFFAGRGTTDVPTIEATAGNC